MYARTDVVSPVSSFNRSGLLLKWLGRRLPALAVGLLLVPTVAFAAGLDGKTLYSKKGCAACHGLDGRTPSGDTYPIIAGQMPRYTYLVLKAYQTGERQGVGSNLHVEVSDLINDEEMKALAEYVATLK